VQKEILAGRLGLQQIGSDLFVAPAGPELSGTTACSCAESRMCRRHRSTRVLRPTRLIRADHRINSAAYNLEPGKCFT